MVFECGFRGEVFEATRRPKTAPQNRPYIKLLIDSPDPSHTKMITLEKGTGTLSFRT